MERKRRIANATRNKGICLASKYLTLPSYNHTVTTVPATAKGMISRRFTFVHCKHWDEPRVRLEPFWQFPHRIPKWLYWD